MMLHSVLALVSATAVSAITASASDAQTGMSLEFDGAHHAFAPQLEGGRTGFTRFASVDAIGLEGAQGRMRLVLELALPPGSATRAAPHDIRISFRPEGFRDYWVSPADTPGDTVVIEYLDLSGPSPRIAGQFTVPLCFTVSPLHQPDPARCLTASGRFDTALVRD